MDKHALDRLCAEALQRVAEYINRAAGQHMRAIHAHAVRARITTERTQ